MDFMGLIGTIIAVGGVLYGIITRFNHIEHLMKEIRDIKDDIKDLDGKIEKHSQEIGFLQGKTNGKVQ